MSGESMRITDQCYIQVKRTTLPQTRAVAWEAVLVWPGCGEEVVIPAALDQEAVAAAARAWLQGAIWGHTQGILFCVGCVEHVRGQITPLSSNIKELLERLVGQMMQGETP